MKKWKKWLQEEFLPMWAKETVLHDNRRLAAENRQLRQRLQVVEGYVRGLEAGLRSSRRAKRGEGGKA